MLALGDPIAARDGQLSDDARVVERGTSRDFVPTTRSSDADGTTGFPAVHGW